MTAGTSSAAEGVAVRLERVGVRRDGRAVLDEVTLEIAAGEIHVIVGKNGAGKSSLLLALLGQLPFTGAIELRFAADASEHGGAASRRAAAAIGFVPQSFAADRTMPITLGEFLALSRQRLPVCLGITRAARARIAAILERVGLAGMERRRIGELSGGEQRRLLIGNALELGPHGRPPQLLLCDEPAAGLDAAATAALDRSLAALRDEHGTTVVLISHDRAQILRLADRVSELSVQLRRTGPPAEVLAPEALAPEARALEAGR
jgi:zinc transport system ATP-binding protein